MHALSKWMAVALVASAGMGCAPKAAVTSAPIEDRFYTVSPDTMKVKSGLIVGEITEMKIMERVEQGTGRIDIPAKFTGKLKLTNSSPDMTVRIVSGRILYIDDQGKPIALDPARTPPTLKFASSYNAPDRLDPGQDTTQTLDADFPPEALAAKKLKEIRLELAYIPSPYKQETANFVVAIGGQPGKK